jgi:hypothetical protein
MLTYAHVCSRIISAEVEDADAERPLAPSERASERERERERKREREREREVLNAGTHKPAEAEILLALNEKYADAC